MINIAVAGLGYWGPNLARNIASLPNAHLHTLCDQDQARLQRLGSQYPGVKLQTDFSDMLSDPSVDAVVLATPVHTHFALASAALRAGKHILVEKPLAQNSAECQELIALAEANDLTLMVGHVFLYNAAVQKVKEYITSGELGDILYIYSQRLNLGIIRRDVDVLWNFAPHDLSILCYWLDAEPEQVYTWGHSYIQPGIDDVVFMMADFPNGVGANVHLSWLDPNKVRRMTVVGSRKMVVYDDVSADAKIVVYDKGVDKDYQGDPGRQSLGSFESFGEFQLKLRAGDVLIPQVNFVEPLRAECQHFADSILNGTRPRSDGYDGLRVVRAMEIATRISPEAQLAAVGAAYASSTASGRR